MQQWDQNGTIDTEDVMNNLVGITVISTHHIIRPPSPTGPMCGVNVSTLTHNSDIGPVMAL
jgi:hypothetical protein